MKQLMLLALFLTAGFTFAQYKDKETVEAEGRLLYRMEKSSWYGTDHFLDKFSSKRDSIGGYVSYENDDDHTITTVFFNRFNTEKVLVRYVFDPIPKPEPLGIDTLMKASTDLEKELLALRQKAEHIIYKDTTGFFSFYENTSYNIIPLIKGNKKLVYTLTGPQEGGNVWIGNDYLLTFDKKLELKERMKLHNTVLLFPFSDEKKPIKTTYHSHVVTDLITVTDVCTLLLYKDYLEWSQHYVLSEKMVTIYNIEKDTFVFLTKEVWDKINSSE